MTNNYDESTSKFTSRREFLKLLGLGPTALGLSALGGIVLPQNVLADCEPPGNPGTPKAWGFDCRPIRPRRPASSLSSSEITKLKNAYQAMRDLDTSDPNDPRGFQRQANIHCWYCSEITPASTKRVHFNAQFLPFHRAYLYFHERILGKLIGDMEFRLPYWDWDVASHREIPSAYNSPNSVSNPLWNSTREMSTTEELPDEDVGEDVMEAALSPDAFPEFGDDGILENTAHGSVHVDVGGEDGDMSYFETAAKDPIFYAHHGNVDKVWSDWNKASPTHTNPTTTTFLNLSWNFFDENKVWRKITAAQVLDHETKLRYTYGPSRLSELLPCIIRWTPIKGDWKVSRTLKLAPAARQSIERVLDQGGRARLHFKDMVVPMDKSAVYRMYSSADAARRDSGPGSWINAAAAIAWEPAINRPEA
jgi:polyphenol oxidase